MLDTRRCARCDTDLTGKRPHAIYCSRRCKTSASDDRRVSDGRAHARDSARYEDEAEHRREYARNQSRELRVAVLAHFGTICVACASDDQPELDHVHGNGERHRNEVGHGDSFHRWLIREGFPAECEPGGEYELQVLCRPCHAKKTKLEREGR